MQNYKLNMNFGTKEKIFCSLLTFLLKNVPNLNIFM